MTFQIHSRIGESGVVIIKAASVPLLSQLHVVEIEHNELIDNDKE